MEQEFYYCEMCQNLVIMLYDSGIPLNCCGEDMQRLAPSTSGASEKHQPIYEEKDGKITVSVATVEHPMSSEHYIQWVALKTNHGIMIKYLNPTDKPTVSFALAEGEHAESVYSYCNLHGLWHSNILA